MAGHRVTKAEETESNALAYEPENSMKRSVSMKSGDAAHEKESLEDGTTTCKVTTKQSKSYEVADSSQSASPEVAKVDKESKNVSACEKASLSKTFLSKSVQGSPLDDSNENSMKRPVSINSGDAVTGKESSHGGTATSKVTAKQSETYEAADSSQSASPEVAKVDKKSQKVSACEKASLSKTFLSKSVQGSSLNDSNENSMKRPVGINSDDAAHEKESSQGGTTTCEVAKQSETNETADSSQSASPEVDKESKKVSAFEKASHTPLSKAFVSKSTQGASLDDNNVSGCVKVETKDEVELPILSQWLQTPDVDKKTAMNAEVYPFEDSPKEVKDSEEDLNQLLLEKLEMELGGIPTIEDLDEDPILRHPMGWIQDDPDCLEGERSEVRSKGSSSADFDDNEGRKKRKLSEEMLPGTKRSKVDLQTAGSSSDLEDCTKKGPVLYSLPKDKFDVKELTPTHQSFNGEQWKLPDAEWSMTLPGRDQLRNGDCGNIVHQPARKTSKNKALETHFSPANFHPFSMSENLLVENRKPCYYLVGKDPERFKMPSNPRSMDQQGTAMMLFAATQYTSQQGAVPANISTDMELKGVNQEKGPVHHLQNAQFKPVNNSGIVDKPRSVLTAFGGKVVARDIYASRPTVPHSQNVQFRTVQNPSIVGKPRGVLTSFGESVVAQDIYVSNPTLPHSQHVQFKPVNTSGLVDKPRNILTAFGERVVARDIYTNKQTVPQSQNVQLKTIHNPQGIVDKTRTVLTSFDEGVVAQDIYVSKPTVPNFQNVQFKTVNNPGIVNKPRSILMAFGDRVVARDILVNKPFYSKSAVL